MTEIKTRTETEALFHDLDKPSLENLSYVLKHPEMWPEGFVWRYEYCQSCAMGLAHQLWREKIPVPKNTKDGVRIGVTQMARIFAIPHGIADRIFAKAHFDKRETLVTETKVTRYGPFNLFRHRTELNVHDAALVTPEMVAGDIDAFLAKRT